MKTLRYLLLEKLYEWSKIPYRWLFKNESPWGLTVQDLLSYPSDSLGYHLGCFLLRNHFTPEPQLEDQDVFHVLTQTGISVPEEIAMQFYLLGNGKRSAYLFTVICVGLVLFPDELPRFTKSFKKGKTAARFYDHNFLKLLPLPLQQLQQNFKINFA